MSIIPKRRTDQPLGLPMTGGRTMVQQWIEACLSQGRDDDLYRAMLTSHVPGVAEMRSLVQHVVHAPVIRIGASQYHVTVFSIPITVSSGDLSAIGGNLESVLPMILKVLQEEWFQTRNVVLVKNLVSHAGLRDMPYSKLYSLAQELFYVGTRHAGGAVRPSSRIQRELDGHEMRTISLASTELSGAHIVGMVYSKARKTVDLQPLQQASIRARLRPLLEFALESPAQPVSVQIGELGPLCEAIGRCAAMQAESAARSALEGYGPSDGYSARIQFGAAEEDALASSVTMQVLDRGELEASRMSIELSAVESANLLGVANSLDLALLDAGFAGGGQQAAPSKGRVH